jgi:hypothetical protein
MWRAQLPSRLLTIRKFRLGEIEFLASSRQAFINRPHSSGLLLDDAPSGSDDMKQDRRTPCRRQWTKSGIVGQWRSKWDQVLHFPTIPYIIHKTQNREFFGDCRVLQI